MKTGVAGWSNKLLAFEEIPPYSPATKSQYYSVVYANTFIEIVADFKNQQKIF